MKRYLLIPAAVGLALAAMFVFARAETPAVAEEGGGHEFLSQKGCKKCHFKQARSWKKTKHAMAMDNLKPGAKADEKKKAGLDPEKDYTKDEKCLACHTTGYGETGGYPKVKDEWSEDEAKLAKNNAGVGCEMCHGAGKDYSAFKKDNEEYKLADVVAKGLIAPVTAENCTGCHTKDGNPTAGDDYVFDFEKSKDDAEAIHEHIPLKHEH